MIPRAYIIEWQQNAPWQSNAQIEQDLIIERALAELFSDELIRETLAFRGGTALHKIFLKPQVRYSEDIDLVQIKPIEIGDVLTQIRKKLSFIDKRPKHKSTQSNNTLTFRCNSEIAPVQPLKLKIEINCREHYNFLGLKGISHTVSNSWFSGDSDIISFELEELLGTKLRALFQRKKGRDLFDLYYALTNAKLDIDKVLHCYRSYMKFENNPPTSTRFLDNMEDKMRDSSFLGDINALIRPEVKFDMKKAYDLVKVELISKI